MKIKEQLEDLRVLYQRNSEALRYMVLGLVTWTGFVYVSKVGGMPNRTLRIGMMDSTDPYVIVHYFDSKEVVVCTPEQVAQWPDVTVRMFPGLAEFLRKYATKE